jgi:mannose-6-phosphate isomerase-like protein (cupin superfamily)
VNEPPHVVQPGEGRSLDIFGTTATLKATSVETGGAYSLVEAVIPAGGFAPPPHRHLDRDEVFYVLEGQFDFRVGEDISRAKAGALLHVPRGTLHGFTNAGDTPGRLLDIHMPALDGYFLELGELAKAGAPEPGQLAALMRRWSTEVQA